MTAAFVPLLLGSHPPSAVARPVPAARLTLQPSAGLRLSAEELRYHPGHACTAAPAATPSPDRTCLELRGKVMVEVGSLKLQAGRLSVELDDRGRPSRLTATGRVAIEAGEARGEAGEATLELSRQRVLALSGGARVRLAALALDLSGQSIELDLGTGGLRVRAARATLHTDQRPGPPRAERETRGEGHAR